MYSSLTGVILDGRQNIQGVGRLVTTLPDRLFPSFANTLINP